MKGDAVSLTAAWNPCNICASTVTSLLPCPKLPVSPEVPKLHNANYRAPLILASISKQNKKVEKISVEDEAQETSYGRQVVDKRIFDPPESAIDNYYQIPTTSAANLLSPRDCPSSLATHPPVSQLFFKTVCHQASKA